MKTLLKTLTAMLGFAVLATSAHGEEEKIDWSALEALTTKAEAFSEATAKAEEAGEEAPAWSDFYTGDPSETWSMIKDYEGKDEGALEGKLNDLSEGANKAIYDNIWTNASQLTAWLTHNIWVLIAAALVFIMHLGFSTLESGLCQKKNVANILFKNCWIIATGLIVYFVWGFNAHYPGFADGSLGIFAMGSPAQYPGNELLTKATNLYHDSYTWYTDFIFQGMFAATAATIVSGAVAERIKLSTFMIYAVILVGFAYPLAGSWHWGGGFLANLGTGAFYDFAGSTVVHAFGGFAALAAVMVLGPRRGKYTKDGTKPILPHSLPLAAIGAFILFFGWFGFNGGSVLAAEPNLVSIVFVTTSLAAAAGAVASIATAWIVLKKPDVSMALNGFLAGLVGITAGADAISPMWSLVAGGVAGVLVVISVVAFDKLKIDDPVGAISVHGVCGIWGTLAVAFFGGASLVSQVIGIVAVCLFAFVFSLVLSLILKAIMGIRVDEQEEVEGLDVAEHGSPAYSELA